MVVGIVGELVVVGGTGITDKEGWDTFGLGAGFDTVCCGGSSGEGDLDTGGGEGFLIFSQGGHSHWISILDSSSCTICL